MENIVDLFTASGALSKLSERCDARARAIR